MSENFTQLLAGRSVQGIGGGGILALGMVILTDIIPLRQRPIFIGVNQISWALGSISGAAARGTFRSIHNMALDLLHQLPLLRHRVRGGTIGDETTRGPPLDHGATPVCGLVWIGFVHRQHNQFFDRPDLGWFPISLVKLADLGSSNRWHCRVFGHGGLGALLGIQTLSASRAFQFVFGNRRVLVRRVARAFGETSLPFRTVF